MARLSEAQRSALTLLHSERGVIDCYDDRAERYSDDGNPDTWNQLFDAGLAEQWYDTSDDTGTLRITDAGRTALEASRDG